MACVRRTAVIEFLPFEILPLFRIELGRDKRGLGARRITGSISADAAARTAAPATSAMSVMFFIYIVGFFWFLHADNSRLSGARIWDQSPTLRRIEVEALAAARYLFSANGASSLKSLGHRPRTWDRILTKR